MANGETGGLVDLDFTFGLPPSNLIPQSNQMLLNSMPIARIYPGLPSFAAGIDLFTRASAFSPPVSNPNVRGADKTKYYHNLLKAHGFSLSTKHNGYVEVAFLADSFPTDSFSNEYGENFLQKFTDVASEGEQSLAQIAGGRSVTEGFQNISSKLSKEGGAVGALGSGMQTAGNLVKKLFNAIGSPGGTMVNTVNKLMAGGRMDFPMVWKSSGFQPSYTMTVRLYNPNPGNAESTKKYIIGPIAALMLLGIPISDDGITYRWPFIHRIASPGIYDLDPAFISNITVIKGGDQQLIGYNQSLAMADVRIDFGSLFSSILATGDASGKSRPTLRKYLQGMETTKQVSNYKGESKTNSKSVPSPTVKIPQKIVEKTQAQKSNPPGRDQQAEAKVAPRLTDIQIAELISSLKANISLYQLRMENCPQIPGATSLCVVTNQNKITRDQFQIDEIKRRRAEGTL